MEPNDINKDLDLVQKLAIDLSYAGEEQEYDEILQHLVGNIEMIKLKYKNGKY